MMKYTRKLFCLLLLICFEIIGMQAQNTVKDADGNLYQTVKIGNQVWMAENLKTTKYNDGKAITYTYDSTNFLITTDPTYYLYNNDTANKSVYGVLYNWYGLNTKKLCPTGWHVPVFDEWTALINFLGGEISAGGKLKEAGTKHWAGPNAEATNVTGFTALPGGYRMTIGGCDGIGTYGGWWSLTEVGDAGAQIRDLGNNNGKMTWNVPAKSCGFSVRCLKD